MGAEETRNGALLNKFPTNTRPARDPIPIRAGAHIIVMTEFNPLQQTRTWKFPGGEWP